jgi:energy-coupling factor transport system ATP-binding protein
MSFGVLSQIDFFLQQGEVVALMGPNGAGKSTLARILAGLIEPSKGEIRLIKSGVEKAWTEVKRWQEIGLIGQHPRRQTIGATVAEELGFGLLNLGYGIQEARERVKELAFDIGLGDQLNQSPATLSGGERQRLVLAAILALKPSFLILDEALTMLDERSQERCLKMLEAQGKDMGQLWITHDPYLASKADRLLILEAGRLLDMGKPDRVLEDRDLCEKFSIRHHQFRSGFSHSVELWEKFERALENSQDNECERVLQWQEAEYSSRLKIDQEIRPREFIGIVGPSGAGKSSLLDSSIALINPTKGQFLAFGERISKKSRDLLRQKIRLMVQEPGEYQIGRDVYHEVFYLQSRKERKIRTSENLMYLKAFGISEESVYKVQDHLSGGERQRVALAAALESLPEVLLLDEPLLGLDAIGRGLFQTIINELKGKMTVLYVTHDLSEIENLADRLWLIEDGALKLDCNASDWAEYAEQFKEAGVRIPKDVIEYQEGLK